MNFKKFAIAAAVAGALSGPTMPAFATVTGVPGEALLVPLMLTNVAPEGTGNMNTYVQIRVPDVIGQDFVIQRYTAPNVTGGGASLPVVQNDADFRIHWVIYDHNSNPKISGTCYVSAGDSVLWSTDYNLRPNGPFRPNTSGAPSLTYPGAPNPYCGPTNAQLPPIGYVVFETYTGSDGLAADFAMEGSAWITDYGIGPPGSLLSVPVIPMADGEDPADANNDTTPVIGSNEVIITAEYANKADGRPGDPTIVAPLAAGIRLNNGDGDEADPAMIAGGVQGNLTSPYYSLHSIWLDSRAPLREAFTLIWDEHENFCNSFTPLPYEVNLWAYNLDLTAPESDGVSRSYPWDTFQNAAAPYSGWRTDITNAVLTYAQGRTTAESDPYCVPAGWDSTIMGYAEYTIPEQNDVGAGTTSAGVAFEAQVAGPPVQDAWSTHMMTSRGRQ